MYQAKYNPNHIIADLENHNIDIEKFTAKVIRMSGGAAHQAIFELVYETLVVNSYNQELIL
ncbi:hypothetical protein LFL96_25870 [Paraburkholderia sp. D15]|uniref:hypothetical protein n=1 Tax=Paraburkholderia sp. D15 TaxID=2880218 RepID=UPI002479A070|nr:hypothetical protein [Paraburkholderia sp. D15]WGS54444.1 hypothetical protein LFL96_25870 [Paraburkholderia sp. D15]